MSVSMAPASRWLVLSACIIVQSVGGLQYMFGTFSGTLKSTFRLQQGQLDSIGTAANIGANTGFYLGYLIDSYGPTPVLIYAAILGFSGFFFTWASLHFNWDMHNHVWALVLFSFIQGHAQQSSDIAVIPTVQRLFAQNRGSVTGLVKAFVGLSGSLATVVYVLVQDARSLLLVLSLLYATACVTGAALIHNRALRSETLLGLKALTRRKLNRASLWILGMLGLLLTSVVIDQAVQLNVVARISLFLVVFAYFFAFVRSLFIYRDPELERSEEERSELVGLLDEATPRDTSVEAVQESIPFLKAIRMPVFWFIWLGVFVTCGTGLMLIVNVGQLVYVVGLSSKEKTILVSLLSICNCSGRITGGFLSDIIAERFRLPNLTMHLLAVSVMGVAMTCVLSASPGGLFAATLGSGFAYGVLYGSLPVVVGENFGIGSLGSIYAFMALGVCTGSLLFAKFLFASVYEEHAYIVHCPSADCDRGLKEGDETCSGRKCVQESFETAAFCCFACACLFVGYLSCTVRKSANSRVE